MPVVDGFPAFAGMYGGNMTSIYLSGDLQRWESSHYRSVDPGS